MQDIEIRQKQKEVLERIRKRSAIMDIADIMRVSGSVVYLLLDTSGSMEGQKLAQAKKGAINFAEDARGKGYAVGVITFSTTATHLCEPQQDISTLNQYLERIDAGGSTNMTDAILLALQKMGDRGVYRTIVIVTDGMPDSQEIALEVAQEAKASGIDILTIGTDDADRDFLAKLASKTELSVKVLSDRLEQGITSMAKMLPLSGKGDRIKRRMHYGI
jgi:Mg-chelatase subunit ChlD